MIEGMQVDWDDLSSVHRQFAKKKASTNSPLRSRKELEAFLEWWVAEKWGRSGALGNVQPLWELVRILELHEPKSLLQILDEINDSGEDEAVRSHDQNYTYSSLPTTLTTYVVEKIESTIQVDQLLQNRSGDDLLRYQIKVIRNTFLWLDDLLPTLSSWVGALFGNDEKSLIPKEQSPCETEETILHQITWLSLVRTRDFLEGRGCLDGEDFMQLSGLWKILHDNNQMPIKYAFRLAVVGAKGDWQEELAWYKFNTDILQPLLDIAGSPIYGNIADIFVHFYTRFGKQPDALGLTWTKEELQELGQVYAGVAAGSDIEQHLFGYPANPAGAVASVLPEVLPEDMVYGNKHAPVISRSKNLFAIRNKPCRIRSSMMVASDLGVLILQRSQGDTFGGKWEFPGGQINADEDVSEGSVRELREETGLEGQIQLHSFDILEGVKYNLESYQFNSSAKVEGIEPGWERRIRLSEEHQGFAWIKEENWSGFAPGREKNIQEGLKMIDDGNGLLQL
jgi:8-oxo-dGTP diphosphatase